MSLVGSLAVALGAHVFKLRTIAVFIPLLAGLAEAQDTSTAVPLIKVAANTSTLATTASSGNVLAPTAAFHEAAACTLVGTLTLCQKTPSVAPDLGSDATSLVPSTGVLICSLTAVVAVNIFAPFAIALLVPLLAANSAEAKGTSTSIPCPEIAVNTSTFAPITVTETYYVLDPSASWPTPTVTHFIAACTPYCAQVNEKSECVEAHTCKNVVGTTSGAASVDVSLWKAYAALAVAAMIGKLVGRLEDGNVW